MFFFLFTTVAAQLALIGKELVLVRLTKVSTLQGKIHAVNTEGVQQWTLETGKPLVSSYYSENAFEESSSPLIPTITGDIVTLSNGNFIKLKVNIKDLVDKPPSIIENRLYIGEKYMRAYVIDKDNGNVVGYHEANHQHTAEYNKENVLIGLMDYVYQVIDIQTMSTI